MASRQGNAIAGLEASATPAEAVRGPPAVWNDRTAFCEFVGFDFGGVAGFFDAEEDCRIQDWCSVREGFAAIRAAAMIPFVEFMTLLAVQETLIVGSTFTTAKIQKQLSIRQTRTFVSPFFGVLGEIHVAIKREFVGTSVQPRANRSDKLRCRGCVIGRRSVACIRTMESSSTGDFESE